MSEHRVLTAIALLVGDEGDGVKLSLTDLEQLTGLSRFGVRSGVKLAVQNGHLKQGRDGNSYIYSLCFSKAQDVQAKSTKYASRKHTLKSTPASEKHKSVYKKAQQTEASPYIENNVRTYARGEDPEKAKQAYGEVAYAAGHPVAEWLRDNRNFDFVRAFETWGDKLEELWKAAVRAPARKPGDKAKFRFQDACEGDLDLGVHSEPADQQEGSALPKISFGDIVYHPEQGEFIADFEALYEEAWRCPEGHFIPASELQVVRSAHA